MKMTMYTAPTMVPRQQTKERLRPGRPGGGKRLAAPRSYGGKARSMARRSLDPCDNSNDSGLGFDHHVDRLNALSTNESLHWADADRAMAKRQKVDVKLENDEVNDSYSFPEHTHTYRDTNALVRTAAPSSVSFSSSSAATTTQAVNAGRAVARGHALLNRIPHSAAPVTLTSQLQATSRYRDVSLSIVCQPEQQHRARYQTEGSRGAVKDRSGNSFPVVQLVGYSKPATLQVFIGSDQGKVAPHMFYQACKVSGKNSTPCNEKKVDGTIVIELQLEPSKDMQGTCDCVGILKERNVDVEHRFPDQLGSRAKKKSTRCRMVFRTTIAHADGTQETLQVCSQPIVCTQPPGVPEISKKSLTSCPAGGGLELFIIGKNFLKDTVVAFQMEDELRGRWEQSVVPDKEFLQQTHLICVVPPFLHPDITEPVSHTGSVYAEVPPAVVFCQPAEPNSPSTAASFRSKRITVRIEAQTSPHQRVSFLSKMMPPPDTSLVPLSQRRLSAASIAATNADSLSPPMRCPSTLKQEFIDENSQNSILDPSELPARFRHISESSLDVQQGDSNLSMINDNSMDMMHHSQMLHMNENSNLSVVNENSMDVMSGRTSVCADVVDETSNHYSPPQRSPESKVMDLRRKMPMATVADLVNTKEPSMATLQSFGIMEQNSGPLPAQTAQSIENYLTNIENKNAFLQTSSNTILTTSSFMAPQMMSAVSVEVKSEAGTSPLAEPVMTARTQNVVRSIDGGMIASALSANIPNVMVNCAVDSIVSPKESNILLSQDVMMPAMIQTTLTPPLAPPALTPNSNISPEVILNSQISPSLMCRNATQDALLPATALQPLCQPPVQHGVNVETTMSNNPLLASANTNLLAVNAPENAIILSAAADLLETQKNISEILTTANGADVMPMGQMQTGAGAIAPNFYTTAAADTATLVDTRTNSMAPHGKDFMMPVTVAIPMQVPVAVPVVSALKEMQQQNEKKCEEELRMVPPSLATMSENDLINIINPSCFDQV